MDVLDHVKCCNTIDQGGSHRHAIEIVANKSYGPRLSPPTCLGVDLDAQPLYRRFELIQKLPIKATYVQDARMVGQSVS